MIYVEFIAVAGDAKCNVWPDSCYLIMYETAKNSEKKL
jgi:hypothetical protein